MKQTAVEWLIEQLKNDFMFGEKYLIIMEQAKEMEKEQIIRIYTHGWGNGIQGNFISSEEYYKENFNK